MRWTIAQVAGAVGAQAGAGLDSVARVAGVSIDSRTVRAGELFVAIHGPRHDGHDHLADALERGALAAIVAREKVANLSPEIQRRAFAVDDTLAALHRLAARACGIWRARKAGRRHC